MTNLFRAALCLLLAVLPCGLAQAQAYPARAVTIVVPFAAGGPTDAAGRIVARALQGLAGQPFVVENIAGAGSTIGAAHVAHARPDGYTLLLATSSAMVVGPHLYPRLTYDGFRSFAPIGLITEAPFILLVRADSPFASYADLVKYGQANPGKLNYATPGIGTVQHLGLERLIEASRFSAVHIPFKGTAPAMVGFLGGEVDFLVETPNAAIPLVKAGRVRALVITGPTRLPSLAEVPTLSELGVEGLNLRSWFALMAPKATPEPVLATARKLLGEALAEKTTVGSLGAAGFEVIPMESSALHKMMEQEYAQFGDVIRSHNLTIR